MLQRRAHQSSWRWGEGCERGGALKQGTKEGEGISSLRRGDVLWEVRSLGTQEVPPVMAGGKGVQGRAGESGATRLWASHFTSGASVGGGLEITSNT